MTDRDWTTYFEDYATRHGLSDAALARIRASDGYSLAYAQWETGAATTTVDGILDEAGHETAREAARG